VAVDATYPRLEQNVTQFVLGIMAVQDQPAGEDELRYFGALFMLGGQIAWEKLGGPTSASKAGIGRRDL
jgi:predicted proteasome-type protease